MKTRESGLILPSPLDGAYAESTRAQEVYERIHDKPLDFFESQKPEIHISEINGDALRYAVYGMPRGSDVMPNMLPGIPSGEYSVSGGAIVQHLSAHKNIEQLVKNWVNGVSESKEGDEAYIPHFYFPLPRIGRRHSTNISLKRESLAKIMQGDFTPLIDLRLKAIETWQKPLDIDMGDLRSSGHSFDATVEAQFAAKVSQEFGGKNVRAFLSEIATMDMPRTAAELQEDFMGGGIDELAPLFDASRESGMEAVTKAQGVTNTMGSKVMLPRMAADLMTVGAYSQTPLSLSKGPAIKFNKAAQHGLAARDSAEDIRTILENGGSVTVAKAELSDIFKAYGFERAIGILGVNGFVIKGRDHAYHDNPIAAAIAADIAFNS